MTSMSTASSPEPGNVTNSGVLSKKAEARRLQRETTGSAVLGVPTGLAQLDSLLGGLNEGLYLLAGPPGMGKTTLGLQVATAARRTSR
jgi:replicative DNA helicase